MVTTMQAENHKLIETKPEVVTQSKCSSSTYSESDSKELSVSSEVQSSSQASSSNLKMSSNIAEKLPELQLRGQHDDDAAAATTAVCTATNEPTVNQSTQACKQVFLPIACLPYEKNLVYCFILSVWDNIIGPQTVQVWKRKPNPHKLVKTVGNKPGSMAVSKNTNCSRMSQQVKSNASTASGDNNNKENILASVEESSVNSACQVHTNSLLNYSTTSIANTVSSKCSSESQASSQITKKSLGQPPSSHTAASSTDVNKPSSLQWSSCEAPQSSVDSPSPCDTTEQARKRVGVNRLHAIVQYVTEHTVTLAQVHQHQQQLQPDLPEPPSPAILVLPHHGIIVQALRFVVWEAGAGGRDSGLLVPHCLSMVVSVQEEHQLLNLQHLTAAYLTRVVRQLHLLLGQSQLASVGTRLQCPLTELCMVLVSLRQYSLARYPLQPSAQPPPDQQQALRLLTSHLQTGGCTVLLGDTSTAVNKVLLWLAHFLSPSELHVSRLCVMDPQHQLQPGLLLQGMLHGGSSSVSGERLLQFGRPVTLCDLNTRSVKQTLPPPSSSSSSSRKAASSTTTTTTSSSNREVVREVSEVSCLVRGLFQHMELLASHGSEVRTGYIKAFMRSLRYQALAAVTWITHAKRERRPRLLQGLREVLAVNEASLAIILCQAETLQPGIVSAGCY